MSTSAGTPSNPTGSTATLNDLISDFFVFRFGKMSEIQQMRAIAYGRSAQSLDPKRQLSTSGETLTGNGPRFPPAQLMVHERVPSDAEGHRTSTRVVTDVEILKTCAEKLFNLERTHQRNYSICDEICKYKQTHDDCHTDSSEGKESFRNILDGIILIADREFVDLYGDADIAHLSYLTERERRGYIGQYGMTDSTPEVLSSAVRELVEYLIGVEQGNHSSRAA